MSTHKNQSKHTASSWRESAVCPTNSLMSLVTQQGECMWPQWCWGLSGWVVAVNFQTLCKGPLVKPSVMSSPEPIWQQHEKQIEINPTQILKDPTTLGILPKWEYNFIQGWQKTQKHQRLTTSPNRKRLESWFLGVQKLPGENLDPRDGEPKKAYKGSWKRLKHTWELLLSWPTSTGLAPKCHESFKKKPPGTVLRLQHREFSSCTVNQLLKFDIFCIHPWKNATQNSFPTFHLRKIPAAPHLAFGRRTPKALFLKAASVFPRVFSHGFWWEKWGEMVYQKITNNFFWRIFESRPFYKTQPVLFGVSCNFDATEFGKSCRGCGNARY